MEIAARLSSTLSIIGTLFIVGTFLSCPGFHQPINRLVFYASWGNLFSNVATMISISGINAGRTSPLCQIQAFFIQMFIPADALWNLVMATNVYLSIFRNYSVTDLRRLEWRYLMICYGIPLVPAIIYLPLETKGKGRMYGPATIWCSISKEWAVFRIATFYGPAWVIMLITFTIHALVGSRLYRIRRQFRKSRLQSSNCLTTSSTKNQEATKIEITEPASSHCDMDIKLHVHSPSADLVQIEALPPGGEQPNYTYDENSPPVKPANRVTRKYARYALLFFVALIFTWIPSSANRVYNLVHPHTPCFSLNFLGALVLPSQGFWNALIYINTSLPVCRRVCKSLWARCRRKPNPCAQTTEMPSWRDENSDSKLSFTRDPNHSPA